MTMEMILALGILVLMIVLIMSDKMPFGAPPLLACLLLVVSGLSTVQQAFAGFVNPSVVMIAGFMVVMAALQKTRLISNVKSAMISLVNKGSYRSYGLLLVIVMLGASLAGTGATGYYVLILSLVSTIPYSKKATNIEINDAPGICPPTTRFFLSISRFSLALRRPYSKPRGFIRRFRWGALRW